MDTNTTLALIDVSLTALKQLRETARQMQMPARAMNPFGSVNLITQTIQNLEAARGDISKGIVRDRMGNIVPADEIVAVDDLAGIIDN